MNPQKLQQQLSTFGKCGNATKCYVDNHTLAQKQKVQKHKQTQDFQEFTESMGNREVKGFLL